MPRRKFNPDVMNMASPPQVAMAAMNVLDRLQDFKPEIQVMGAAVIFLELCDYLGVPPQEAFVATKNLINGDNGKRVEFLAVRDYMEGEL